MPKDQKKTKPAKSRSERIDRAEVFAYEYIRCMGNGAEAARKVYSLEGNAASQQASRLLTNAKVQEIIGKFLKAQRESLKEFTEQTGLFLTISAQALITIIQNPDTETEDVFTAIDKLMRLGGFEMSEKVAIARVEAKAIAMGRGRAQLPGVPAPGIQPGANTLPPAGSTVNNDNRSAIFLLTPPPMPEGGVPPPALASQWAEMGWRPGVARPAAAEDNARV